MVKSKIRFDELNHKYYLGKKELISVTSLLKKHGLSPDYSNVNEAVLKAKAERGSVVHRELEQFINNKKAGFTSELEQFTIECSKKNINPTSSEFIVNNNEVAGTVDVRGTIGENELPFIGDFKTTANLHKDAVAWQLSLYAYLSGEIFEKLICFHFPDENTIKTVELTPIPEEEIERLLECEQNFTLYQRRKMELDFIDAEKIVAVQQGLKRLDEQKKELQKQEDELKEFLISKMEENVVKSIDNSYFKITYVESFTTERIDSIRLKKEKPELAAEYTKTTTVKPSVRITLKEE